MSGGILLKKRRVSGSLGLSLAPRRAVGMLLFVQQLEELPHIWSQGGEGHLELWYCYQGLPFCGER